MRKLIIIKGLTSIFIVKQFDLRDDNYELTTNVIAMLSLHYSYMIWKVRELHELLLEVALYGVGILNPPV